MSSLQNLQTISTKELRDNLAEILEQVAIGKQEFVVTKFGRKKAKLGPAETVDRTEKAKKKIDLRSLPAYGMWKDREDMKDAASWVAELRRKQSFRIRDNS